MEVDSAIFIFFFIFVSDIFGFSYGTFWWKKETPMKNWYFPRATCQRMKRQYRSWDSKRHSNILLLQLLLLVLLLQSKYEQQKSEIKTKFFLTVRRENPKETADKMANKGEDSNTTTDDNISLNEVNWLNLDVRLVLFRHSVVFHFVTFR